MQVDKMTTEIIEMKELKKKRMTMNEMRVNLAGDDDLVHLENLKETLKAKSENDVSRI